MKLILVVDDDADIGNMEEEVLRRAGYDVERAYSGTEARLVLENSRPDLILLDLMLPGLCGEELIPLINDIPIIVVSAKAGIDDKVSALTSGAADYMTKPFDTKELLARISARLRERPAANPGLLVRGGLTLDTAAREVRMSGETIRLTKTEYAILRLLMANRGQVIAKSVILDRISLDTPDCTESSLKTHMSHLRSKLRAAGDDPIEAIWGIGFRIPE